jgi:hypothetical protein
MIQHMLYEEAVMLTASFHSNFVEWLGYGYRHSLPTFLERWQR